jgi:hypothetical protein
MLFDDTTELWQPETEWYDNTEGLDPIVEGEVVDARESDEYCKELNYNVNRRRLMMRYLVLSSIAVVLVGLLYLLL